MDSKLIDADYSELERRVLAFLATDTPFPAPSVAPAHKWGDRVSKVKGSAWTGHIVGFYSTSMTPIGYAVESETEHGSVQIYPEAALRPATLGNPTARVARALEIVLSTVKFDDQTARILRAQLAAHRGLTE